MAGIEFIDGMKDELVALSREIHAYAEPCFKEFKSADAISSFLEKRGFDVERGVCGLDTAFKATAKGSKGSPAIAFIAEYDAVPGLGHGCGHNLIAMASVGAAVGASKLLENLKGSVIVMGTPAEEGGGGKIIMVEKGAFEGIDVAMMVHPGNYTKVAHDFLALSIYSFRFRGRTSHASAAPYNGLNALDAAVLTCNAIGLLRQQVKGDCRIHVHVQQDEVPINMIPDSASCRVVVRAPTIEEHKLLTERVKRCAQGAAMAAGCEVDIEEKGHKYQPMKHNRVLIEMFLKNLNVQGITEEEPTAIMTASTDAGNVSQIIPTTHPYIAICGPEIVHHTKEFVEAAKSSRGEETSIACAKAMAMTAVEILASPQAMDRIRKSQ